MSDKEDIVHIRRNNLKYMARNVFNNLDEDTRSKIRGYIDHLFSDEESGDGILRQYRAVNYKLRDLTKPTRNNDPELETIKELMEPVYEFINQKVFIDQEKWKRVRQEIYGLIETSGLVHYKPLIDYIDEVETLVDYFEPLEVKEWWYLW